MFTIREIDHIVLRALNPQRMLAFYCDILGCTLEKTQSKYGLFQLRAGRCLIDIVDVNGELGRAGGSAPGLEGRNLEHFCLRIEPFDEHAIRDYFATHGVTCEPASTRYGAEGSGPSLYLQDPENNTVELKGPPNIG